MAELTDAEIDAALERGQAARLHEPRAAAARYDRAADRIVIDLTNGCTFSFPRQLAQGLQAGTADQLAALEILGAGTGLHWEALDVDLSIAGLLAGRSGTAAFMAKRASPLT